MRQLPLSVRLADRAVFESFLVGGNAVAVAQLEALASAPRPGLHWVCGPEASGKTHLLQALCARAGSNAAYVPLPQLLAYGPEALAGWHGRRWLCVDDVAVAIGQADWERALFAAYRDGEDRGACLVMAARAAPAQLRFALPDLASRCIAGQRLDLRPLDEAQQCAALQLRARLRGIELSEEAALYLQRRLPRDMSSRFALLEEIDSAALAAQRRPTIPFIREVLARRAERPAS